jgi:hypothetical protein
MIRLTHGTVHGKTIELTEDLGLAEGQLVEVQVTTVPERSQAGDGILRTAGALADDPYWDDIMEDVYRSRHVERRTDLVEE